MNCPRCQMANPEGAKFCLNCGNQLEAQVRVEGERKYVTVLFADVGDEIRTEYTAMGDTTNVAARLQSAAEPGSVLISADTYHLVKQLFELRPRGGAMVKGKSAPIVTYEVLSPRVVPGKVRGLEGLTSPLVGRAAEFKLVNDKLNEVREGRGAFVAVIGEAGLGKSRLLAEISESAKS